MNHSFQCGKSQACRAETKCLKSFLCAFSSAEESLQLLTKLHEYKDISALYEKYFDSLWKELLDNVRAGSLEKASAECSVFSTLTAIQTLGDQVSPKLLKADTTQRHLREVIQEMKIFEADSSDESRIAKQLNVLRALIMK